MQSAKKWLMVAVVSLLILVIAGPEFGAGLELVAIVDLLGTELFLLSLLLGLRLVLRLYVLDPTRRFLERVDPYFFVPTRRQIGRCPGIVAHAMPGFVATYVAWVAWGVVVPLSVDV